MAATRYPQFCALARAAEVVGERWTLLILRELWLGPRRFSDLRERLDGVSTSVLAERLGRLEDAGVVARRVLAPPAASTVYELTASGRALEPVLRGLLCWGARLLLPPRPRERLEPDWLRLALGACARRGPTPPCALVLRVRDRKREIVLRVVGGPEGTVVAEGAGPAEATLEADARTALALMSGALSPRDAVRRGILRIEGDPKAAELFPEFFEVALAAPAAVAP